MFKKTLSKIWLDPRFGNFQDECHLARSQAAGVLILFWEATRAAKRTQFTQDEVMRYMSVPSRVPNEHQSSAKLMSAMLMHGYLRVVPAVPESSEVQPVYVVVDNEAHHAKSVARAIAGQKGGMARPKNDLSALPKKQALPNLNVLPYPSPAKERLAEPPARVPPTRGRPKALPANPANAEAWGAYARAYEERYTVAPVRNAKTNGMIASFVRRIGGEDSARVLNFYVHHNDSTYVLRQHDLALALRDCEGLHTQWKLGRAITRHDARSAEREDDLKARIRRLGGEP